MRLVAMLTVGVLAMAACTQNDPVVDPEGADHGSVVTGTVEPDADPVDNAEDEEAEDRVVLTADLDADGVVPGPGDAGSVGAFRGVVQPLEAGWQLCFDLQLSGVSSPVVGAHIHVGAADEAGPVVVGLPGATDGEVSDCVDLGTPDYERLTEPGANLYVNVHTQDHPDGAMRGQLAS